MTIAPEDLPAAEARRGFARLVGQAEYAGVTTYITNHGRRVAAIVPVEAAELLERIEDERLAAMARAARDEGGPATSHEDLMREFGLR
jgi:prevent-host-death family protein